MIGLFFILIFCSIIIIGSFITVIAFSISIIGGAQYVKTPEIVYSKIFYLANIKAGETFAELGSGLGYLCRFVADQDSTIIVLGIELSWPLYFLSQLRKRPNLKYISANVLKIDYSELDVIYCYLLPKMLAKLDPIFKRNLKKRSRVITYGFPLLNRQAVQIIERTKNHGPLFLYEY